MFSEVQIKLKRNFCVSRSIDRRRAQPNTICKGIVSHQIVIKIKSEKRSNKIYGAFLTKLEVDFENFVGGKVLASNSLEVTGSSSIGEKESYLAATKSLEEQIEKDGILKVLGIIN